MPEPAIATPVAPAAVRSMPRWAWLSAPVVAVALVIFATRDDPLLSPDSITYLSAADHIRAGQGITDFTTKPLSVFGPLYPLLLSPGGRSLVWATIVGGVAIAAATTLMWMLLRRRVDPIVALGGALALGASQGLVRMASVVWSDTPYAAIAIGMLALLARQPLTTRRAALGGLLAGAGFLTRYAGVGTMVTGAVMVVAASRDDERDRTLQRLAAFASAAIGVSAIWVVRNLIETGQPLGPRFEGGIHEPVATTIRLALMGTGHIVAGDASDSKHSWIGWVVVVAIAVAAWFTIRARTAIVADVGVAVFATTSFVVPIVARMVTANDIELRVMSPMLIPLIYFAATTFDRLRSAVWNRGRAVGLVGLAVLGWWVYQGVALAARFPDLAPGGSGYKPQYAPQLYDTIDSLPADAVILTNNPQRVWWFTHREPTFMGFTRPRPGNSHYPLDADDTLQEACSGHAYLAWFDGLQNAGGGPEERRPDLAALVDLQAETAVPGGQLYLLVPHDPADCRSA